VPSLIVTATKRPCAKIERRIVGRGPVDRGDARLSGVAGGDDPGRVRRP
jgi:hypothetical protein